MILLQMGSVLAGVDAGTRAIVYFGIGFAGVALLILIGVLLSRRNRPRSSTEIQQYSKGVFRRAARSMGLEGPQIDVLEDLVRACKVRQPLLVFTSPGLLDDTLKKGLYSIDVSRDFSEEQKESRKAAIFQIKQTIERNARKGAALGSTTFLRPGQALTITPEGAEPFSSRVISNMKDFVTVAAPAGPAGAERRWMRGTKLSVYLWRENDAGYSFASKVLGYDTMKGVSSVLIQHSKTLRREQRRHSRRREIMRPCFCYPIRIEESGRGRKAERKAVVEHNARILGTVVDLSAGGCGIQTLNPFERGKLVMTEFDIDRVPIRAFGKVMHVQKRKGQGGVMHLRFTRVTRQHLNKISEFVYDFTRPTTVGQARMQGDRRTPGRSGARPAR